MEEQYHQLKSLTTSLPECLNYKSISQFNLVLNKYLRILDYINGYNPEYKSFTRVFYSDIINMRDHIERVLLAQYYDEKENAFNKAISELKTDIHALARLIHPHEELVM